MKIVTVNIPESFIASIERLVGEHGLYPSRSELIRVAVREFLMKELQMANNMTMYTEPKVKADDFDKEKFVRVPIVRKNEANEPVRDFKTFKIVSKLDSYETSEVIRSSKKKKIQPLGNPFWTNKLDKNGNLIRVPKN